MNKRETALQLLIEERDALNAAIGALQQVVTGGGETKRRGRPRKNLTTEIIASPVGVSEIPSYPKKRHFSASTRRKMAAAQKARWAKAKAEGATNLNMQVKGKRKQKAMTA